VKASLSNTPGKRFSCDRGIDVIRLILLSIAKLATTKMIFHSCLEESDPKFSCILVSELICLPVEHMAPYFLRFTGSQTDEVKDVQEACPTHQEYAVAKAACCCTSRLQLI
jgi:hypothetical protein